MTLPRALLTLCSGKGARQLLQARPFATKTVEQIYQQEFPFARPHNGEPPREFAELRKKCPVATAKLFDDSDIWLITKHEDLKKVLTDNRLSKVSWLDNGLA